MERYTWSFDDKTLTEVDKIRIKKGEVVRFRLINETMMHHPIHLHGHFFRVLNGENDYAPLKHTVNVPALDTVIIEFAGRPGKGLVFPLSQPVSHEKRHGAGGELFACRRG